MEYQALTDERRYDILRGRLVMLEEHHYKVMLDIEDAESVNDADTRQACAARRITLEQQIANTKAHIEGLPKIKEEKNG